MEPHFFAFLQSLYVYESVYNLFQVQLLQVGVLHRMLGRPHDEGEEGTLQRNGLHYWIRKNPDQTGSNRF